MRVRSDPLERRWLLWGTLSVVYVLVNLNRLSTAVLAEDLMAAFQTTAVQLGTLHAAFFYVYALMQIPTGILADRIGPRLTATIGALTMNVGVLWFAYADTFLEALLARGLVGLGGSVIFVCILRFCASWFRAEEFATMSGLTFAVAGLGGILATTPLAVAADTAGWRATIGWLGLVGLAFALATFLLIRDTPEHAGFSPLEGVPNQPTLSNSTLKRHLLTVVRDRHTWVIGLLLFCTSGMNLTLFGLWGVPYVVQTYGLSVTQASYFTLIGGIGLLLGPPSIGWLSDRLERRTELMIVAGVCYVVGFASIAIVGDPPLPVVALVYFTMGTMLGAFVLSYAVIKERHPTSASGISTGTVNGAAFFGAAALPTLMGGALDAYWTGEVVAGARVYTPMGYRLAFAIATAAAVAALGCALWLHRHERRTRHRPPESLE